MGSSVLHACLSRAPPKPARLSAQRAVPLAQRAPRQRALRHCARACDTAARSPLNAQQYGNAGAALLRAACARYASARARGAPRRRFMPRNAFVVSVPRCCLHGGGSSTADQTTDENRCCVIGVSIVMSFDRTPTPLHACPATFACLCLPVLPTTRHPRTLHCPHPPTPRAHCLAPSHLFHPPPLPPCEALATLLYLYTHFLHTHAYVQREAEAYTF